MYGGSGAGKSASFVIPNALQLLGSYVFTDPKGELYDKTAGYFKAKGYDIKVLNLVHPQNSDGYNPLHHINNEIDVDIIANTIVKGQGEGKSSDPFWDDMGEMLMKALIYYLKAVRPLEEQSLASCSELVRTANSSGGDNLLTNLMNYFDKFLIYPMFGATSVAVYYAVNSMSKIASLITNPMSSVILSWVSNSDEKKAKKKILKLSLISNIPILIVVTIITIPLTYIALRILYSQYLEEALLLILPIAITTAFGTAATLIKSVLLKYSKTNKLVFAYIVYFIIFAILGYFMSKTKGLVGFTIANLISKVILWGLFIILLFTSKNKKTSETVKDN